MTGDRVKALITEKGYNVAQVAEMIGTSQQNLAANLKHNDIRSGLIEKIAEALGIKLAEFYGEAFGSVPTTPKALPASQTVEGLGSTAELFAMLKVKDEQLTLAMKQTSTAQDQTTEALAQMRQIIERLPRQNPAPPIVTIETGTSQQGVHLKTGGLPTSSVRRTTSRRSIGGKGKLVTSKKD